MAEPLLEWTGPLTAEQRRADIASDLPDPFLAFTTGGPPPDPADRDQIQPGWPPTLPSHIPQCRICTLPSTRGLCGGCRKLEGKLGCPVDSLEFLAVSGIRDIRSPEAAIYDWKETVAAHGAAPEIWLLSIAAGLSAYVEAQRDRLLAGSPLVTVIPSRAPVIAGCFWLARQRDWYSIEVQSSGRKRGDWFQHGSRQPERLSRTTADWVLESGAAAGRPVLIFDDVFVTGASIFSYATALKQAGAREVRVVAVIRHLDHRHTDHRHTDYWDALRIVGRTQDWDWTPTRAGLARLTD